MKTRRRKAANAWTGIDTQGCAKCGAPRLPHRVCLGCGCYGKEGRKVIEVN
jgi:large subunit ribosomal protein L32